MRHRNVAILPEPEGVEADGRVRKRHYDAVSILSVIAILLAFVPSRLVVGPLGSGGTPATLVGVVALAWWCYGRVVPDSGLAKGFQPVRVALALWVVAVGLSYVVALTTRYIQPDEVNAADSGLLVLAGFCGITLLGTDGIASVGRMEVLLRRIVLFATILAAFGMLQFFTGFDIASYVVIPGLRDNNALSVFARSGFRRIAVTAVHPVEFGIVLATAWPLAVHFAFRAGDRVEVRRRWIGVAVLSAALMVSLSRSAILGVAVAGIMMMACWSWRRRVNALAVGVLFTGAMRLVVPGLIGTLRNLFVNYKSDTSYTARTERYPKAFALFHQRPIFGRGFGTLLPQNFYGIVPLDNELLATAIEVGVIGLAALVGLVLVGVFVGRGARRRSVDPNTRDLAQALAASIAACAMSFPTVDTLAFRMAIGTWALMLGCCGALWRLVRQDPTVHA